MDLLDRMLGHDQWTTNLVLDYCRDLTDAQLDQEFDIGHRTLRATLDHMIFNVDHWTSYMTGQPRTLERKERPSIAELRERHERVYPVFAATARRIHDEGRLGEVFLDHYDYPQSCGSTIYNVIWHNATHRSEARHILERLGVTGMRDLDPQEWEHLTVGISPDRIPEKTRAAE